MCDIAQVSAWERSGKFEGDIMLTDDKMRNGLANPARRWPTRVVPFDIDRVFSEYCSTNLQSGIRGVNVSIHELWYPISTIKHWSLCGRSNDDSYV